MHLRTRFHSNVLLQYYRLWWPYLSKRNGKNNRIAERIALLDLASGIISIITPLTILNNNTVGPNLSWSYSIFNKVPIFWEGHKQLPHRPLIIWRYKVHNVKRRMHSSGRLAKLLRPFRKILNLLSLRNWFHIQQSRYFSLKIVFESLNLWSCCK